MGGTIPPDEAARLIKHYTAEIPHLERKALEAHREETDYRTRAANMRRELAELQELGGA